MRVEAGERERERACHTAGEATEQGKSRAERSREKALETTRTAVGTYARCQATAGMPLTRARASHNHLYLRGPSVRPSIHPFRPAHVYRPTANASN